MCDGFMQNIYCRKKTNQFVVLAVQRLSMYDVNSFGFLLNECRHVNRPHYNIYIITKKYN